MRTGLSLHSWCAYSPDFSDKTATPLLDSTLAVDVSFLPAMKRRRLSQLSRLSLRLAHTVAPEFKGPCVFGSQHGEIVTTQGLLQSIVENDVMSPAGFTASVHNTAVGLHSINNHNTAPCTSIAAGTDTLAMCFIEASAILAQTAAQNVLIVFADDKVPEPLARFVLLNNIYGIAALVGREGTGSQGLHTIYIEKLLNYKHSMDDDPVRPVIQGLLGEVSPCYTRGESSDWSWQFNDR